MDCIKCKYAISTVVDTHYRKDGMITRRRECLKCGNRFNTIESAQEAKQRKQQSGSQQGKSV